MKKIIYLTLGLVFLVGCQKEYQKELLNDSIVEEKKEEVDIKDKNKNSKSKYNVVHNGKTLNINENAVFSHLKHGDFIGSVEDNVKFQSILIKEESLPFNSTLFSNYRNSNEFINFDEARFGQLDFYNAKLGTYVNGERIIFIPSKNTNTGSNTKEGLAGFVSSDGLSFYSIFVSIELTIESVTNVSSLNFERSSGHFSFYETTGELLVTSYIKSNKITDIVIGDDETTPKANCFRNCYKQARENCSSHFACDLACTILTDIPCIIGTAMCCAGNCAFSDSYGSCM